MIDNRPSLGAAKITANPVADITAPAIVSICAV